MPSQLVANPTFTFLQLQAAAFLAQGLTHKAVADELQVTREVVSTWMQNYDFRLKVAELQKDIQREITQYTTQKMHRLQVKAIDRLDMLLDSQAESVALNAVKEVLERGPLRIARGLDVSKMAPGTVVLQERMLVAMHQVSHMTGDIEMEQVLTPLMEGGEGEVIEVELGQPSLSEEG